MDLPEQDKNLSGSRTLLRCRLQSVNRAYFQTMVIPGKNPEKWKDITRKEAIQYKTYLQAHLLVSMIYDVPGNKKNKQ